MRLLLLITFVTMGLSSCELIVIGSPSKPVVNIDQNTPIGAVLLFKTELDSSNVPAATQILAKKTGVKYLAFEKYELYYEIARIGRIISQKSITKISKDSLSQSNYRVNMELEYLRDVRFDTRMINDQWYITEYESTMK